jgi:hypothetical protein
MYLVNVLFIKVAFIKVLFTVKGWPFSILSFSLTTRLTNKRCKMESLQINDALVTRTHGTDLNDSRVDLVLLTAGE